MAQPHFYQANLIFVEEGDGDIACAGGAEGGGDIACAGGAGASGTKGCTLGGAGGVGAPGTEGCTFPPWRPAKATSLILLWIS